MLNDISEMTIIKVACGGLALRKPIGCNVVFLVCFLSSFFFFLTKKSST